MLHAVLGHGNATVYRQQSVIHIHELNWHFVQRQHHQQPIDNLLMHAYTTVYVPATAATCAWQILLLSFSVCASLARYNIIRVIGGRLWPSSSSPILVVSFRQHPTSYSKLSHFFSLLEPLWIWSSRFCSFRFTAPVFVPPCEFRIICSGLIHFT